VPIRRELRKFYGHAWRKSRARTLALLGNRCSRCTREHPRLNLAHLLHDPKRGDLVGAFCPSCHATVDARQRHAMTRRTRSRRNGQLWLWDEVEWAPFAAWMIPRAVLERAQGRLFE
jgi:hypothetical protein